MNFAVFIQGASVGSLDCNVSMETAMWSRSTFAPVRHQLFIQTVQNIHVILRNFQICDICILDESLFTNALGKRNHIMLQPPSCDDTSISNRHHHEVDVYSEIHHSPHEYLSWSARILLGNLHNCGMTHSHGSSKRCVRLDGYVVFCAGLPDVFLRVERVDLDLVYHRLNSRVGTHQLFNLDHIFMLASPRKAN